MKTFLISSLLLLALVASSAAQIYSSPEAMSVCENVGKSSGCSGCNAPSVDCEWCTNEEHDVVGAGCVPEGWCSKRYPGYAVKPSLCPAIAKQEPHQKGLAVIDQVENALRLFSSHFDSHYCDFPTQPWPVDRTANPLGHSDPTGKCERVNTGLATGERAALESCLKSNEKNGKITEKRKACLRLYQSLQCTIGCPEYGKPMDFMRLCPEVCQRLHQHCDEVMMDCMLANGLDTTTYYGCTTVEDSHCYTPNFIDVTGKFEYDLCFYGSDSPACV